MKSFFQLSSRLARLPVRVRRDAQVVKLLKNWPEAMAAAWAREPIKKLQLRNGVVISAPAETLDLWFLFHETWVRKVYSMSGYEIRPGDVVIDVGANIGVFALYAATRAADVKVYSYEPYPGNVSWLKKNIANSKLTNVQVYQEAIAGASGTRRLQVVSSNWQVHTLIGGLKDAEGLDVRTITLAEVMRRNRLDYCDLLKMDCEGAEYEILQNCPLNILHRIKRIVMEYHEGDHIDYTGEGLCRYLESQSFRIDRFDYLDSDCGILCAANSRF